MLAAATEAGVRFRWAGADLQVDGLGRLPLADQVLLARHLAEIIERLAEPGDDGAAAIAALGIEAIELVTSAARAARWSAPCPAKSGSTVETEAAVKRPCDRDHQEGAAGEAPADGSPTRPGSTRARPSRAWSRSTTRRPGPCSSSTCTTCRSRRCRSSGGAGSGSTTPGSRPRCWAPRAWPCPARSTRCRWPGCSWAARPARAGSRPSAARSSGSRSSKGQQLSRLVGAPAVPGPAELCRDRRRRRLRGRPGDARQMDERLRRCFRLQNAAVPVVARMRLAGVPFDREAHLATIERWERELAEKRAAFVELTGEEPPARHKVGAWIEAHLPAEEIAWMPRTAGRRAQRARRPAQVPGAPCRDPAAPARALGAQAAGELRRQAARAGRSGDRPDLPRLHDLRREDRAGSPARARTRSSCRATPARRSGRRPGRRLVRADLDQIELRVFAEEANEQVMRDDLRCRRRHPPADRGLDLRGAARRRSASTTRGARRPRRSTSASSSPPARGRSAPRRGRSSTST